MRNTGWLLAAASYALWGIFPIYWRLLRGVPAFEILSHRVVWALAFCTLIVTVTRDWRWLPDLRTRPKVLALMLASTVAVSINWLTYIWAVNTGHIVDASLGYFVNPLVSIAAGVLVFRERLRAPQWLAIGLAALGVLYLAIASQTIIWIALTLAFSFGAYGCLRKLAPVDALQGLTIETALIAPAAIVWLICCAASGQGAFLTSTPGTTLLLMFSGVLTAVPLLLFAAAARAIPMSLLGVLQYITPTLQFLIGTVYFNEPFTPTQLIGYGLVWIALLVYAIEGVMTRRAVDAGLTSAARPPTAKA
jgi:chloramphenicol-sensitive protein RarD